MAKKTVFETPEGKRYMNTKVAGDLFGLSKSTVAKYCAEGRIVGVFKDSTGWCIPFDAVKPMTKSEIRKILLVSLKLKNNPSIKLDYTEISNKMDDLRKIYSYLSDIGYLEDGVGKIPAERLPYEVVLSEEGIKIIGDSGTTSSENEGKSMSDWVDIINSLIKLLQLAKNLFVG